MCLHFNIDKFRECREYCKKYGFGYIVVDDRWNSFYSINEENESFTEAVLKELDENGSILLDKFRELCSKTEATPKQRLATIKNHGLFLDTPFILKRRE